MKSKSFGSFITKQFLSFMIFIIVLGVLNVITFGFVFRNTLTTYNNNSTPGHMLKEVADNLTADGVTKETANILKSKSIWAMYLSQNGSCIWSLSLPEELKKSYTIQDVALFSKGYLADYPVFVQNVNEGLLVLGYPKNSYTKLTSNYYSINTIKLLPVFVLSIITIDIVLLFLAYLLSKRKIIKNTEPIVTAIETISNGKPVNLHVQGELSDIANSINKASNILKKQNESRANWISGVSHDIRTPLSMILGYAKRIEEDELASSSIKEQANIVELQSIKIKELVNDLNLVSQLEYEMQPIHTEPIRLSKQIRLCIAELFNTENMNSYSIEIEIDDDANDAIISCDVRLISRAITNLVHNSMKHNPQGCTIRLRLTYEKKDLTTHKLLLIIEDDGIGFSEDKLYEINNKPHYLESLDERLDLRHGLGLLIVKQIVTAHNGTMTIEQVLPHGCRVILGFNV